MKYSAKYFNTILFLIYFSCVLFSQVQINPPFSMPDVNIIQAGDRAYAFCGTDIDPYNFEAKTFIMPYWRLLSSTDLINWEFESYLDPANTYIGESDKCFAGHGITRNGKWYWYFSNYNINTGVAVSDSPEGPWIDVLGKPLLPEDLTDTKEYDKCIFIDDDGQAYMTFGSHKNKKVNYYIAALNEDMISLNEEPRKIEVTGDYSDFTIPVDASFLHKKNDLYYLSWRSPYAVSKNIYGPYKFMGKHDAYGHLGFFSFNNQDFVNYTTLKDGYRRRYRFASIAYVHYLDDGRIAPIEDIILKHGVGQYSAGWAEIEAEWFMSMPDGPQKAESPNGGHEVRNLKNGDYLYFPNINDCAYNSSVLITYSSADNNGGEIIIKAYKNNGPELGRVEFRPTGDWKNYDKILIPLGKNPLGTLSLAFVIRGEDDTELIRIDKFKIVPNNNEEN